MYSSGILLFLHLLPYNINSFADEITPKTAKIWTIYYPHQFDRNKYCQTLKCSIDELCVVSEKTGRCIKNDKLHDIDGVHIDFATGKLIDHHAEEASYHYRTGRIKPQHKHEHLPRHYQHAETTDYGIHELQYSEEF